MTALSIDQEKLRTLGFALVMVLKEITGAWQTNTYREKFLRNLFDSLTAMHLQPPLGQKRPHYPGVRVYTQYADPRRALEPSEILKYLEGRYPNDDCMFDLRVVTVDEGVATNAFLFQWDVLVSANFSWRGFLDPEKHRVLIPDDVDEKHLTPKAN